MDRFLNLNGDLLKESQCGLSIQNRGFKFGDSLFESIRIYNGKSLFLEDHFSRLSRGMKELKFEMPTYWNQAYFKKEIVKVTEKNDIKRGGRVRFTVFRKGEGFYTPKSNEFAFTIESYDGENNEFKLNEKGLKLGIYNEIPIYPTKLTPFKTSNCLPFILAGLWANKSDYDDVLLLNDKGNIVEATSSNVFVLIDGMLYTPALKDGPTAGIMRKKIIQILKKGGIAVIETSISPSVLENADEVFLTNAITGLQWVASFKKNRYFHKKAEKFITALNQIAS